MVLMITYSRAECHSFIPLNRAFIEDAVEKVVVVEGEEVVYVDEIVFMSLWK